MSEIGVGVIGVGRIGAIHFANVLKNTDLSLKWIIDVNKNAADEFAKKVPIKFGCKSSSNIEDMLQDPSVQGVIICTPTSEHTKSILSCLRAGKAVMCEKPIAMNLNDIDSCYNESKRLNVPLLCGYQRRHDASFSKTRDSIKDGVIGKLHMLRTSSRDHPYPTLNYLKISGKILHDCCSHDLDVMRWLTGEDPVEVFAMGHAFNPQVKELNDWDTVNISLKFPSGTVGNIDVSRFSAYGYDQRIEAFGDKGMVQANNQQPTSVIVSNASGVTTDPYFYSFPQRYEKTYAAELAHFVQVIQRKVEPILTHQDVRKVTILASACEESCETGKPVQVKYD